MGRLRYFLVAWIAYSCPGDFRLPFLGEVRAVPPALVPLVCKAEPRVSHFVKREEAHKAVLASGSSATLAWCERLKCRPHAIEWQTRLVVNGQEVR